MPDANGEFDLSWHLEKLRMREARRLAGLEKLVNLTRSIAGQRRMTAVTEPKLISAMYQPSVTEATSAVADVLAELCPEPDAA